MGKHLTEKELSAKFGKLPKGLKHERDGIPYYGTPQEVYMDKINGQIAGGGDIDEASARDMRANDPYGRGAREAEEQNAAYEERKRKQEYRDHLHYWHDAEEEDHAPWQLGLHLCPREQRLPISGARHRRRQRGGGGRRIR